MAVGHYATIGGGGVHSVWLDHGFAKLDVPFGCRLGYTIGMSALKVSNLGGPGSVLCTTANTEYTALVLLYCRIETPTPTHTHIHTHTYTHTHLHIQL